MNERFEVVNKKDGTRLSRSAAGQSTTLFASKRAAEVWRLETGLDADQYSIQEAAA